MKPGKRLRSRRTWLVTIALFIAGGVLLSMTSCSSRVARRNPTGEVFPTVKGESLAGDEVVLPDAVRGQPALLLVGYKQSTQFDLDRWLLGLQQAQIDVKVYEVPTIPGMLPGMWAKSIDNGMRKGIPPEDWASVVTVYKDAPRIVEFTGNDPGLPGRILLLNAQGEVVFFHDEGYSVGALMSMRAALEALQSFESVDE